jgi:alkylation response protein AidB-like acyl-CoA dehydrogenase
MSLLDGPDSVLRDSVRRALADMAPHGALTAVGADPTELARRHWEAAAGLGWLNLVDSADAGASAGRDELLELAEELGAGLFCGPFLASGVLAPSLARAAGGPAEAPDPDGAATCLASPLPGNSRWLLEHPDLASRALLVDCAPTGRGPIRVEASLVPCSELAILARPDHLDPSCPLAEIEVPQGVMERRRIIAAELDAAGFAGLFLDANLALAGECAGVAAAVLQRALDWCAQRRQFGRPIGSFQAVKHKLADLYVDFRKALVCARASAARADAAGAAVARVLAADAALGAARGCIQLLGGAGISWEVDAHLYLKRALRLNAVLGGTSLARASNADLLVSGVLAPAEGGAQTFGV